MSDLCLACASSLPPRRDIHTTSCCSRPICPSCLESNPRLARYNPCLACLGGIAVIANVSGLSAPKVRNMGKNLDSNLSGEIRDQDAFVLGDDSDEEESHGEPSESRNQLGPSSPEHAASKSTHADNLIILPSMELSTPATDTPRSLPYKYFIARTDTLQGISLRFSVPIHEICKINGLSSSVLGRMPHLLHTRHFLFLPATTKAHPQLCPVESLEESGETEAGTRRAKLVRERAEKKFQTLTKEVDWRIAKTYVALADGEQEQDVFQHKKKEMGFSDPPSLKTRGLLESIAIETYLADEEWEAEEMKSGRGVCIRGFPFGDFAPRGGSESGIESSSRPYILPPISLW